MKKYKDNYVKKETEIKTILIRFNYTRKGCYEFQKYLIIMDFVWPSK